jgi:hypothetical protein
MYTSAALIPRIGVSIGFVSGLCTIMGTICLKAYCDNEELSGEIHIVQNATG